MAPSKIRRALGAVKDSTSIGLAKVSNTSTLSELDVAIVKATRHDEYPAEEKHIREILSLTCYSRAYINSCVSTLSRRLGKTRSWTVALKTLLLIHRLLSDGDPFYEQEIFFATRRGTRMLNMSDFRDTSRSDAWDFSAFVRTFARYLDDRLEFRMHGRRHRTRPSSRLPFHDDDVDADATPPPSSSSSSSPAQVSTPRVTPVREMRTDRIFARSQHLMQLMERFLACRPTGAAKNNRIVAVALYPVVKESYQIYFDLTEIMNIFIDRFMELEVPDCVKVYDIFSRLSKQFEELDLFYTWCKTAGISRPSEFPDVDKITQQKLDVMDEFIRDKAALANSKKYNSTSSFDDHHLTDDVEPESPSVVKALPPPESPVEHLADEQQEEHNHNNIIKEEESIIDHSKSIQLVEREVDFLNLRDDSAASSKEDYSDKMALALFDTTTTSGPAWEAFADDSSTSDWETALVQSTSNLSGQKAALGGGFDMLLLDGMYSQPRHAAVDGSGSASSVALPKPSVTPMLALPAPPVSGGARNGGDPFAASLVVPPPAYVQMSEMEKKQQLLVEEQAMWQQYARDGMQGQAAMAKLQNNGGGGGYYPVGGGNGGYIQRF